jgi:hypothetical protein
VEKLKAAERQRREAEAARAEQERIVAEARERHRRDRQQKEDDVRELGRLHGAAWVESSVSPEDCLAFARYGMAALTRDGGAPYVINPWHLVNVVSKTYRINNPDLPFSTPYFEGVLAGVRARLKQAGVL